MKSNTYIVCLMSAFVLFSVMLVEAETTIKFADDTGKFGVVDSEGAAYNVTTREDAYQMTPPKVPKLF